MAATDLTLCPDCGHRIPRDAVRGLCMACMLRGTMPDLLDDPGEMPPPDASAEVGGGGQVYGSWEVLAQAGEGAFGLVYEAEQWAPLHRRAALKVLKPGLDSREVMERFAAERETLAVLDHPGIARVLDAGTQDGRPWIAAEWVEGALSITEYCQQNALTRRDRVRLFQSVCDAVAHAHQRGIIHRDLKPSNILVSKNGVAKVIDFGIARATERVLAQSALVTLAGQVLGTPAYMSPEQAAGHGGDVDTRSDIYSLGAVLYEMLAGALPLPRARLESGSIHEALRTVREDAPVRPSAVDPALRGELEWILLRALAKEPARRYETAAAMGRDLGAWLEGGTVMAAPPGRVYLLRTFIRRHRAAALSAAAVLVTLLAATAGMTRLWLQAQQSAAAEVEQRQRAEGELWQSLVVTAQRERTSQQAGSTGRAMETVRRAAAIRPGAELRDEAIAAMVKPDYGPEQIISWKGKAPRMLRDPLFHPDLTQACIMKQDGTADLVELETCRTLHAVQGMSVPRTGAAPLYSPRGNWLLLLEPTPPDYDPNAFARSPGGRILASWLAPAYLDPIARAITSFTQPPCNLRLWSSADGTEHRLPVAPGVMEYTWSAGDSVLALLRADHMERIAMPEGRSMGITPLSPDWRGPSLSPDAARLAIGYENIMELRDATTGALQHTLRHQQTVENTAWNEDGTLLAVGAHDSRLHVWDTATGLKWSECNGHDNRPANQEFLPGSGLLLSVSWDNTIRLWNPRNGRPLLVLPAFGLSWLRGSGGAVVSLFQWPELRIRRILPTAVLRTARLPAHPGTNEQGTQGVTFSSDSRILFTAGGAGISAWETSSLRHLGVLPCHGNAISVLQAEENTLAITDSEGASLIPWTWTPGEPAIRFSPRLPAGPDARCNHGDYRRGLLAVSRVTPDALDGQRVELWRAGQNERAWDLVRVENDRDTFLTTWPRLAISPDAAWLAIGGSGGACRPLLLRTDAGPLTNSAAVRLGEGYHDGAAVAFSPDSRTLAIESLRSISFWDVATRTLRHRLSRPPGALDHHVAWSPDGRLLAAIGSDQRDLWLLDPATGTRIATLTAPEPAMTAALTWSPDGHYLALALATGHVQLWHIPELRRLLATDGLDWQ